MDPTKRRIIVNAGLTTDKQIASFVAAARNVKGYTTRPGYINMNGQELLYKRYYHFRRYIMYCPVCQSTYKVGGSEIYSASHKGTHYPWHDVKPVPKKQPSRARTLAKLAKVRADLERDIAAHLARGDWMYSRENHPRLVQLHNLIDALLSTLHPDVIRAARTITSAPI